MRNPSVSRSPFQPDPLVLGAATWLACGVVLAGLTPLPLHDAATGWAPAFWLLAAPLIVLLARHWTRVHAVPAALATRARAQVRPLFRPRGPARHHAATPRRLASIRRNSSCMMRR